MSKGAAFANSAALAAHDISITKKLGEGAFSVVLYDYSLNFVCGH